MSESTHQSHKHIITVHNANGYRTCRLCTDTHSHKVLRLNRVDVLVSMYLTSRFQFTNRIQTSNTNNTDFIFAHAAPKPQSSYQSFQPVGVGGTEEGGWGRREEVASRKKICLLGPLRLVPQVYFAVTALVFGLSDTR